MFHLSACIGSLLRHSCGRPRVHGNGFIQLDLGDRVRMHVWGDSRIPRQDVDTQIHDHSFGFTSYVLCGTLTNRVYVYDCLKSGDLYQPHVARVRAGEDTVLVPVGDVVSFKEAYRETVFANGTYSMKAGQIHETIPEKLSISVIVKDAPTLAQGGSAPLVFVRDGQQPDNVFNRYTAAPEGLLWQIIDEAFDNALAGLE